MNRPLLIALLVLTSSSGRLWADGEIPWPAADKLPPQATLHPAGKMAGQPVLQVVGPSVQPITILEVVNPQVTYHEYTLRAKVKYEGVEKTSFLEMWNHFPGGGQYFSRTLSPSGPLQKIEGSSDWREISLPFMSKPGLLPSKLVVNVVLPGKGTVYLTPFTLTSGPVSLGTLGEWWSEPTSGLVGGIGGGVVGLIGALIGGLAGLGKARQLVVGLCVAVIAFGGLCLVAGIVAVTMGQPWYVYYPFLLGGVICVAVCGLNLPGIRKRYDALELRRMTALDA